MKILFLGSSHFSVVVLEKMLAGGLNVVGVITQPDRPSGRGHKLTPTEVKTFALKHDIPVYTFEKVRKSINEIKQIDFDLSVVSSFGQILTQEFLDLKLCINVHPSLLPKYRGATPIQSAILNGDSKTGVTIMKVAKEVDSGDIILQHEVDYCGQDTLTLEKELGSIGGEMVCSCVKNIENKTITFTPQDNNKATLVKKITKEDCLLNPFEEDAVSLKRRVLALGYLGTFIQIHNQNLKVFLVEKTDEFSLDAGQILNNKKRFVIGTKNGAIEILSCLSPSGKVISGRDYLNGHNEILGKNIKEN